MCTQFDAGDIAQRDRGAVGIGAQHDIAELLHRLQLAIHCQRNGYTLAIDGWRGADRAGGDLGVLFGDRLGDVRHRQLVGDQLGRIDPHAHRAFGGELLNTADAVDPLQFLGDVADGIIAKIFSVEFSAGGFDVDQLHEAGRRGFHEQAGLTHGLRQARLNRFEAVLDVHLRHVRVGSRFECRGNLGRTGSVRRALKIEQVLHAGQFALDQADHAVVQRFRCGARIVCINADAGRRNSGKPFGGQSRNRDQACENDDDRQNPGKYGPIDEKTGHQLSRSISVSGPRPGFSRRQA